MGALEHLKTIKPAFWLANGQEACERLAYFGIRAILPLMMVDFGTGGLGLDMAQKGLIYGVWAFIQCFVPMFSGGFAESFGYKKSLIVAFIINTCGYLLMANIRNMATLITGSPEIDVTINFILMFVAGITIGIGTAIFKPPVQGMVARSLNKNNSGFGFGLFYWVVNIGGFLAPMAASALRGSSDAPTWHYVFYGAAFVTLFNLVTTLLFFKEPPPVEAEKEVVVIDENAADSAEAPDAKDDTAKADDSSASSENTDDAASSDAADKKVKKTPLQVLRETVGTLYNDKLILSFLLIVSGFWLMFMQLWDLLPNFLEQWVDRREVGLWLSDYSIFANFLETDKSLKPEMIINIDSFTIILLVLPLSALFGRFRMMTSLIVGMVLSVIGFVLSGMTMSGSMACIAIFVFAIGEIICSPKFNEYIGMTAPADKKAIYMGFSNIPFALGWGLGNILSGPLYMALSDKSVFARKFLIEHGVDKNTLTEMKLPDLMAQVQQILSTEMNQEVDAYQATQVLWDTYSPWVIWIVLGAIGVLSMFGLIVFYYKSGMAAKDNAQEDEAKKAADAEEAEKALASDDDDTNLKEDVAKPSDAKSVDELLNS